MTPVNWQGLSTAMTNGHMTRDEARGSMGLPPLGTARNRPSVRYHVTVTLKAGHVFTFADIPDFLSYLDSIDHFLDHVASVVCNPPDWREAVLKS